MDFTIRKFTESDKPLLLKFLKSAFGNQSIQGEKDRFDWLYNNYPLKAKIYLCLNGEKIIGQTFFLPIRLKLNDEIFSAAFSIDTMISASYRRKGIGTRFHRRRLENYQIALSSGQSSANEALYKKLGWALLGTYYSFRLVRKVPHFDSIKSFIKDSFIYLKYKCKIKYYNQNSRIKIYSHLPEKMYTHFDRGQEHDAFIEVNERYLTWRYIKHPYFSYKFIEVFERDRSLGVCVTREVRPGNFKIVDFYSERKNFLPMIDGLAKSLDAETIEGELIGIHLKKYFKMAGFYVQDTKTNLMGSSKNQQIIKKIQNSNWLLFGGDSDNDR